MAKKHGGICRLTGSQDKFVESHLLPKALTRPAAPGTPWVQGGNKKVPVRNWSSWTDTRLVTRKGEDLLRDLDTWAIPILREEKLVWSGWEGYALPSHLHERVLDTGFGFRKIKRSDWRRMRLFFLSLLWRAAASTNNAMKDIILSDEDLEQIRVLLSTGDPEPLGFYPIMLVQLSTKGPVHNNGPFAVEKIVPSVTPGKPGEYISIFRFYMDGLVIHFERCAITEMRIKEMGSVIMGAADELALITIEFEKSFQAENLRRLQNETESEFPAILQRLAWPPPNRDR